MMHLLPSLFLYTSLFAAALAGIAKAQTALGPSPIVLGQSCALSGPAKNLGLEMRAGLLAAFALINDRGGVKGKEVHLVSLDDGYEPDKAVSNTLTLINENDAFLLIGEVGTPTSKAVIPIIEKHKIPFFAPFTGAELLRTPFRKYVINVRASYYQEMEKLASYLIDQRKFSRISCFYQNDSYGFAGLQGIEQALQRRGMRLVSKGTYERNTLAVMGGLRDIYSADPEAVVLVGAYTACAEFIKLSKSKMKRGLTYGNISFVGTESLKESLGAYGSEGRVTLQLPENQPPDVIDDIIEIVIDKGAGTYRYNLVKPAFENQVFSKISFVKYFPPLDWFIGAGIYNNDMENLNQSTALKRIKQMQFGQGGEIFVFRFDGTIISHRNEQLIGRSIRSLKNENQPPYGETIWEIGRTSGPGHGYVTYMGKNPETEGLQQKLCYVQSYDDWGWVIASSMYMNEMEDLIADATNRYRRISFRNVSTFIILFSMAVSLLLFIAYYYTVKIKQGFSFFTDFFRQAADANVKIKTDALAFSEFEDLAQLANQMVEDRVQKEHLLRRDELRLDTLLRLGMMDSHSLKDKYNFTLQRIVQMTRSQEGYLALVNKTQSHITIISHRTADGTRVSYRTKRNVSRNVEQGGLPGHMISRKNAVICNNCNKRGSSALYPYLNGVVRHLDVPVYNNGVIALVAGVCNNKDPYDNSDVRQVTMVIEGMWLHILKTRLEKKMARLERQIIAVREAERSNIGKILHDDLGSHLSGVELLSKALKRNLEKELPDRAEQLESIRALIVDATEKTRRLARGLYPVHIIENGLEAAIEELAVEIESLFATMQLFFHNKISFSTTFITIIYFLSSCTLLPVITNKFTNYYPSV